MIKKGPDFIGIGAQRSGTSWMASCFWEHPEIFMPGKELHFFDQGNESDVDSYYAKFSEHNRVQGEFTPDYLSDPAAIERIAKYCPQAKLIIILREPAARTESSYNLYRERETLESEISSLDDVYKYKHRAFNKSLYGQQLQHLFNHVDSKNVKVVFYDQITSAPQALLSEVFEFIGVDASFVPPSFGKNFNSSSVAFKNAKLNRALTGIQNYLYKRPWGLKLLRLKKTSAFTAFKNKLIARKQSNSKDLTAYKSYFQEDLALLESLLNKKVPTSWKQ